MKINHSIYHIYMYTLFFVSAGFFMLFVFLSMKNMTFFLEWELFSFNGGSMIFLTVLDWMSMMFVSTVTLISAVICGYSKYYMDGDPFYQRFMFILLLFVSSMMLLILSPNLISLLLGWDGLGLSSYVLVVYYQNEYACNSGMLTILSNRVGDAMILVSICLMYCNNSWNFLLETLSSKLLLALMIISAMTKSAQIPFSAWLPAAMAAPTPVSALVHSSTLVTAGVFLLIRFHPCFYDKQIYMILMIMSSLTMVMSGWMANFEMDMKKIIALSTLSQLGLMMMIMSLGMPELAFFHLISHAMFKSTIFMCAGVMIHNMSSSQDLRLSGDFFSSGPLLGVFFGVTNLSLCGFPFLAGYFSKDLVLENIMSSSMNFFFLFMSMIGTGLTVSYTLRVMYLMGNSDIKKSIETLSDMSFFLAKTMVIMLFMSSVSGFFLGWVCLPVKFIFINLSDMSKYLTFTMITLFFSFTLLHMKKLGLFFLFSGHLWKKGSHSMMYLPLVSTQLISFPSLKKSFYTYKLIDSGWLEYTMGLNLNKKFSQINYNFLFSQVLKFLKISMISMFMLLVILVNFA
uniref:NADH-ubiquinone oxidoreductase chain 5 n=1 Tax=Metacrangonyx goulmimensis TaxID=1199162 RepID=K7ZWL7_9CRUS|nr:NADH dehydrogenase subunit 5 [Metacrangonyx goulmimensis]CCI69527.1 NADH dehydrogenase subunit 5 [Metacrangonyx goulmimensis]